jgi:hypothetical protein
MRFDRGETDPFTRVCVTALNGRPTGEEEIHPSAGDVGPSRDLGRSGAGAALRPPNISHAETAPARTRPSDRARLMDLPASAVSGPADRGGNGLGPTWRDSG